MKDVASLSAVGRRPWCSAIETSDWMCRIPRQVGSGLRNPACDGTFLALVLWRALRASDRTVGFGKL